MWVYLPSTYCPSAQEPEASISDLSWLFPELEQSLMLRSKPMPAKSWQRTWKRNAWLQRLCGRILRPSTADAGVDLWIASLAATRANRSAWQGSREALTILGTFGPSSEERSTGEKTLSLPSDSPESSSLRTSRTIYELDSEMSLETFNAWVTALRQACLRRRKSAHRTNVNDYLSWRTPSDDLNRGGAAKPWDRKDQGHTVNLQDQAAYWQTPKVSSGAYSYLDGDPTRPTPNLEGQAESFPAKWSTPRASDAEKGGPGQTFGAGGTPLPAQAVKMWNTPLSLTQGETGNIAGQPSGLGVQVRQWGTPTSRDWKDGDPSPEAPTNGLLGRQAPRSLISGEPSSTSNLSSHQRLARRQLNPTFVEWLMGWPLGWTVCDSQATEWSRYKLRMRSLLWQRLLHD